MRRTPAAHLRMASTSLAAFAAARWTRPTVFASLLSDEPRFGDRPEGEGAPEAHTLTAYAMAAAARRLEALQTELKDFRSVLEAPPPPPKPALISVSLDDDADVDWAFRKPSTISPLVDFYHDRALAAEREMTRRGFGASSSNDRQTGIR